MRRLKGNIFAKIIVSILLMITATLCAGLICLFVVFCDNGYYDDMSAGRSELEKILVQSEAQETAENINKTLTDCYLLRTVNYSGECINDYLNEMHVAYADIVSGDGKRIFGFSVADYSEKSNGYLDYRFEYENENNNSKANTYISTIVLDKEYYVIKNNLMKKLFGIAIFVHSMGMWILLVISGLIVLSISEFVFLLTAAGHRDSSSEVTAGYFTGIPTDLMIISCTVLYGILCGTFSELASSASPLLVISYGILCIIVSEIVFILFSMSIALRIKLKSIWKNTVIYKMFVLVKNLIRAVLNFIGRMINLIPIVPKTFAVCIILTVFNLILIGSSLNSYNIKRMASIVLFIEIELILIIGIYMVVCLRKIMKGSEEIKAGNLSYSVDTRYMFGHIKLHGETLNTIGEGINAAVSEKMKSERMKTELITNVSHDLKTPITSLINYADLISREKSENEKINEYCSVILRQSERLKRLVEDLVEASKASSGNLEINLEKCDACVFLSQIAGEYEEKLEKCGLTLVITQPDFPINIMADGRRMWRVFDNLMNNICKYSQNGTRVYLSLEETGANAVMTFRNISGEPIRINGSELAERFVRGDSSRNTEGNGLGLSIAKSLVELQNGEMEIVVDGDLFKVVISMPVVTP